MIQRMINAPDQIIDLQNNSFAEETNMWSKKYFEKVVTADDIDQLFQLLLGRPVGNKGKAAQYIAHRTKNRFTVARMIAELRASNELAAQITSGVAPRAESNGAVDKLVSNREFRVPSHLAIAPTNGIKVMLVGSCLMDGWDRIVSASNPTMSVHRVVFNNASALPIINKDQAHTFDFQILQLPMRSLLAEGLYFGLSYDDAQGFRDAFTVACQNLERNLEAGLAYNREFGIVTYVMNLLTPIQNNMGRTGARYNLNNMVYFVEELNRHLCSLMEKYSNVYLLDSEQIVSTFGKRYIQDDSVTHSNHGSFIGEIICGTEGRLEAPGSVKDLYGPKRNACIEAIFNEAVASYRSLRQTDSVKLVIFDLDDTLWRGVAAEQDQLGPELTEGWPLGILEAASYLWRRGILIALCSKNDESNVVNIWKSLYGSRFPLENFVARRINWSSKADNVRDIIAEVNLLPASVLFVDDNPAERALVKDALPGIRTIEVSLAEWKRVLLWSAETQPTVFTSEASKRTETVKAQIKRTAVESTLNREEYLTSLQVSTKVFAVSNISDPRYTRCFELINKTNQFNTTGRRWTPAQVAGLFNEGGRIYCAEITDIYANYGLVSVAVVDGSTIEQFVLSCRVFGMDVEYAILNTVCRAISSRHPLVIRARIVETGRNGPCLDVYRHMNFTPTENGEWCIKPSEQRGIPTHISCQTDFDIEDVSSGEISDKSFTTTLMSSNGA